MKIKNKYLLLIFLAISIFALSISIKKADADDWCPPTKCSGNTFCQCTPYPSLPPQCICSCVDCGSSGSCNYSWQDIGCGQSGGGVSCPSNQMLQKGTAPSYTSHSCSTNYGCTSRIVSCPDQYRCLNTIACGANTEISVKPEVAKINDPVSVTIIVDAGSYGICENDWQIKINGVELSKFGWSSSVAGTFEASSTCRLCPTGNILHCYDGCQWTGCRCSPKSSHCYEGCSITGTELYCDYYQHKDITKSFSFSVPGIYNFSNTAQVVSSYENAYVSTTSLPLLIKAKYGETVDAEPTDVSIDKDVYLGDPSTPMTVDSGTVLGSENGNVIIRGQLNLVARANKSNPIRIIYGKQLIFNQGAQIYLPTSSDLIGGAYIIKKGKPDPYANNSSASVCNSNYDGKRSYSYCGLNKICSGGSCIDSVGTGCLVDGTPCVSGDQCCSGICYIDADGDGYAGSSGTKTCRVSPSLGTDCNDNCATCYPGSPIYTDSPDGLDQDCNGIVDDITGSNCATCSVTLGSSAVFGYDSHCNFVANGAWQYYATKPPVHPDTATCTCTGQTCSYSGFGNCYIYTMGSQQSNSQWITCEGHQVYSALKAGQYNWYKQLCQPASGCKVTSVSNIYR